MTAMSRWDPFRDLTEIQSELSRLFGRVFTREPGEAEALGASWVPAVDLYEDKEKFVLTVELAGISPEDVEISVDDSVLTVKGQRTFYSEKKEEDFHRLERQYGSFARRVTLPATADADRIRASFDAGVLTIEVPKKEEAKPRKIEIKASKA